MIDQSKLTTIKSKIEELDSENKLTPAEKISLFQNAFVERFGPDALKKMSGSELLDAIFLFSSKNSMLYWLEFKNDEVFQTSIFGGIGGGSALKYGMYKRKENDKWTIGSPRKQESISTERAIELADILRERLIAGCNALNRIPDNPDVSDYISVQNELSLILGESINYGWVHKYFSLVFPSVLDGLHNEEWQKNYLIRLGVNPPEGRYATGYYYAFIAEELDIQMPNLMAALHSMFIKPRCYWRIGTNIDGASIWPLMQAEGIISVGWPELGDLSGLSKTEDDKNKLFELMKKTYYPEAPQVAGKQTNQLFKFIFEIQKQDVVVASNGMSVLGVGLVTGEYKYTDGRNAPSSRAVRWIHNTPWQLPNPSEGLQTTVNRIVDLKNQIALEAVVANASTSSGSEYIELSPEELEPIVQRIHDILKRKKQVVLYGPPGTGKTWWAWRAAKKFVEMENSSHGKTTAKVVSAVASDNKTNDFVNIKYCTFHPEYGYEHFIEGYRPESSGGLMHFILRTGVFKKLCNDARAHPEQTFLLIIDEINRGDIPRIFGELLTLLEANKRVSHSVTLPVSGEDFSVPEKVYIIATMNTADRSIALLDTALRRRFGFIELMPESNLLSNSSLKGIPLREWFNSLNMRICKHLGRDARNLQVGHAYFLEDSGKSVTNFKKFIEIIRDDIIPLLEEYCYDNYSALAEILGKGLVDDRTLRVRMDLFDEGREDELVTALLLPCPELQASATVTDQPIVDETYSDDEDTK